eukprot:850074_1
MFFNVYNTAGRCDIDCINGYEVCNAYAITWPETEGLGKLSIPDWDGYGSVNEVVFPDPNPNLPVLIDCWDHYMCRKSEINCPKNADCTVICGASQTCEDTT